MYVSTGVDARLKYEYFSHSLWGQGPQDSNGYALQRYLVHGDVHVTPYARVFLRSGRRSRAMHVGEQVAIQAEWRVDTHLSLVANYTHFFAGRFIRETGPGKDIEYTTAWAQYRF